MTLRAGHHQSYRACGLWTSRDCRCASTDLPGRRLTWSFRTFVSSKQCVNEWCRNNVIHRDVPRPPYTELVMGVTREIWLTRRRTVCIHHLEVTGATTVIDRSPTFTRSPAVARMADRTAEVVKRTINLILPGQREWDGVSAHATAAEQAIIWQKQALLP